MHEARRRHYVPTLLQGAIHIIARGVGYHWPRRTTRAAAPRPWFYPPPSQRSLFGDRRLAFGDRFPNAKRQKANATYAKTLRRALRIVLRVSASSSARQRGGSLQLHGHRRERRHALRRRLGLEERRSAHVLQRDPVDAARLERLEVGDGALEHRIHAASVTGQARHREDHQRRDNRPSNRDAIV